MDAVITVMVFFGGVIVGTMVWALVTAGDDDDKLVRIADEHGASEKENQLNERSHNKK